MADSFARSAGARSARAGIVATRKPKLARQQAIEGAGINPPPACHANGQPRDTPAPPCCRLRAHVGLLRCLGWGEVVVSSCHSPQTFWLR